MFFYSVLFFLFQKSLITIMLDFALKNMPRSITSIRHTVSTLWSAVNRIYSFHLENLENAKHSISIPRNFVGGLSRI